MTKELIQTRKHGGEEYKFFLYAPEYKGEKGCLGIEIETYLVIYTKDNTIWVSKERVFDEKGKFVGYEWQVYPDRCICKSTKEKLLKQAVALMQKLGID